MDRLEKLKKLLWISLQFIAVIAVGGLIYGGVVHRQFVIRYAFDANFIVGAIIILIGLIMHMIPVRPRGKLVDHSNYTEVLMERRENKRKRAYDMMYLGMFVIFIPAVVQFLLTLILQAFV
ncbi:MAG: hypothetical protein FWD84_03795 [Oscillospiraceae bacterium]|nr:hypothetical protein [Oscillospiraceae bacterium]